MGGYHWTEIVFQPPLIYLFALFAVFVPVVNLHFYLVFPRPNPILVRHRRRVLECALRGLDGLSAAALGRACGWRASGRRQHDPRAPLAFAIVRDLSLFYVGLAAVMFVVCVALPGL